MPYTPYSSPKRLTSLACAALLLLVIALSGCTENQRKDLKHMKSGLIGLNRKVTLYDCQGQTIRSWTGRFKVEIQSGIATFIDDDGREIKVSGTYVIEEID